MNTESTEHPLTHDCRSWISNKITILILLIHSNKTRERQSIHRHEIFIEDIEHYFLYHESDPKVWKAIKYLKCYLENYPYANSKSHKKGALHMVGIIYRALLISEIPDIAAKGKN